MITNSLNWYAQSALITVASRRMWNGAPQEPQENLKVAIVLFIIFCENSRYGHVAQTRKSSVLGINLQTFNKKSAFNKSKAIITVDI